MAVLRNAAVVVSLGALAGALAGGVVAWVTWLLVNAPYGGQR